MWIEYVTYRPGERQINIKHPGRVIDFEILGPPPHLWNASSVWMEYVTY